MVHRGRVFRHQAVPTMDSHEHRSGRERRREECTPGRAGSIGGSERGYRRIESEQ